MKILLEFIDANPDMEITFMQPQGCSFLGDVVQVYMLKRAPGKIITHNAIISRKALFMTRSDQAVEALVKKTLQELADKINAAYETQKVSEEGNTTAQPTRRPSPFG